MIKWLNVAIIAGLFLAGTQGHPTISPAFNKDDGKGAEMPHLSLEAWTEWFDRDDPSGTGDWEIISDLHNANPEMICSNPIAIEVQTTSGQSAISTGNVIYVADTTTGFICKNSDQRAGTKCQDYRVRFLCPPEFNRANECWTDWFDRDKPTVTGDWETLIGLRHSIPTEICSDPLQIEAETTSGLSVQAANDVIDTYDTIKGFICKNSDQKDGKMCHDYRVRFRCPMRFCRPKDTGCWTDWFDDDDPSGTGDWEYINVLQGKNPGKICNNPLQIEAQTTSGLSVSATDNVISLTDTATGFICINSDQPDGKMCEDYRVRFMCSSQFCKQKVCWTNWYNRDDPRKTGDWELLNDLRIKNPGEICKHPLHMDVQTADTPNTPNNPAALTGQKFFVFDPNEGFLCRNEDQAGSQCHDYKVRFGCPCEVV